MARTTLPDRLKGARESLDLSLADVGERLGYDKTTVQHWEAGINAPRKDRLPDVARVLRIPIDEMYQLYLSFRPVRKAS